MNVESKDMDKIVIEKGFSLSSKGRGLTPYIRKMEVGDSFVISKELRSGMHALFKAVGMTCSTRSVSMTEVRVWRTS